MFAPCGYAGPVSRHRSEVAYEMRSEIQEMVLAGLSGRQVLGRYISIGERDED